MCPGIQSPSCHDWSCCHIAPPPSRENSVTPEVEKEAHITQTQWMEIRQIVRCIYRDNMMLSSEWVVCVSLLVVTQCNCSTMTYMISISYILIKRQIASLVYQPCVSL